MYDEIKTKKGDYIMVREIVCSILKVMFFMTLIIGGVFFGQATKNLQNKKQESDRCEYIKYVQIRIIEFVTALNGWCLLIYWKDALNTVGIVGIYTALISLCMLICVGKLGKISIRLSVTIAVICIVFLLLMVHGKPISDSNDICIISGMGLLFNIIAVEFQRYAGKKNE